MACFAHLRDSVPSWISDANQLAAHVYTKRAEFAAETRNKPKTGLRKKPATASLSSCSSQRPSSLRAGSTRRGLKRILSRESIREVTKRRRVDAEEEEVVEEEEEEEQEEKPVILYDGHTQKALEQMVRHIWSAKSSIRSSRISTSMQSALRGRMRMRMASTENKEKETPSSTGLLSAIEVDDNALVPDDDNANAEPEEIPDFRITRRPARQKESPYDFIETQLDAAQNLCETAAYRFLREGNCLDELEGLVGAYELVLEAATTMAEQEEERLQKQESELATKAVAEKEAEDKRPGGVLIDGADSPDDINSAILEVDDRSDTSEVSIDITAFRMTRYGQRTLHPFTLTRAGR